MRSSQELSATWRDAKHIQTFYIEVKSTVELICGTLKSIAALYDVRLDRFLYDVRLDRFLHADLLSLLLNEFLCKIQVK